MFRSARFKLAAWYVLIISTISISISVVFYLNTSQLILKRHDRLQQSIQQQDFFPQRQGQGLMRQRMQQLFYEDFLESKQDLFHQLLFINALAIIASAGLSYFLAGKTLSPIQKAMEEQKRFIADAAHEFKTPLTALKTSLEVNLMEKKLDHKAQTILQENLQDVRGLQSLTESLFKLAKVDGHKITKTSILLKPPLTTAIKLISPLAKQKNISIKLAKINSKLQICGDPDTLTELFIIFLDNAIKYSPSDSKIQVKVLSQAKYVHISFSDQGQGIDQKHLPHIFKRFYRADTARTKNSSPSYGLGLSVADKIIHQHSGKIKVRSTPGKGSTFTISIPKS